MRLPACSPSDVALFVDGAPAGSGRVEATVPMIFSANSDHLISPEERLRIAMARQ